MNDEMVVRAPKATTKQKQKAEMGSKSRLKPPKDTPKPHQSHPQAGNAEGWE